MMHKIGLKLASFRLTCQMESEVGQFTDRPPTRLDEGKQLCNCSAAGQHLSLPKKNANRESHSTTGLLPIRHW
jgi:hypothetical protein